jgi:hypothetical protein
VGRRQGFSGDANEPSPYHSDQCLKGQCSDLATVAVGSKCFSDQQCPGVSSCSLKDAVCGGEGSTCKTIDGASTASTDCASGCRCHPGLFVAVFVLLTTICVGGLDQCVSSTCTKRLPVPLGGSCSAENACSGTATCSFTDYTCGGLDVACKAVDGSATGTSPDCKTGRESVTIFFYPSKPSLNNLDHSPVTCIGGKCNSLALVALGGQCSSNVQCPGSTTCSSGICGGVSAPCTTDAGCSPNRKSKFDLLRSSILDADNSRSQ